MPTNNAIISISMPKEMQEIIKKRVVEKHFSTPSDYLRSLVREDIRVKEQEHLEQELLKGMHSGTGVMYGTKEWDIFQSQLLKYVKKSAVPKKSHKKQTI